MNKIPKKHLTQPRLSAFRKLQIFSIISAAASCLFMKVFAHINSIFKSNEKRVNISTKSIFIPLIMATGAHVTCGETIDVFYNQNTPQHEFAANDIKTALEEKNFDVEMKNLSTLSGSSSGKKIVIALSSNTSATQWMENQGGNAISNLTKQAYALRTTINSDKSYWVFGGDDNGAMYGGLQIAENINFSGINDTYNEDIFPHLLKRGIKFNIPFDKRAPTYYNQNNSTSHKEAINNVWDMSFWITWFDEMARHRYNVLSLWTNNPFTSMVNMTGTDYPNTNLDDGVQGYDENGNVIYINNMNIDEKIDFWKAVMKYGRDRGFGIYMHTWNILPGYAEGKHGISDKRFDEETIDYFNTAMTKFLETYPDLTGFGVTPGEAMSGSAEEKERYIWNTYGKAMLDYAAANPQRELEFIHRQHDAEVATVLDFFQPLVDQTNVEFNMSFKYSQARAHAAVDPSYWDMKDMEEHLEPAGIKSWLTIRNDDWYFLHWADPQFVRDYVNNFPSLEDFVEAIYIGADGWTFTREFASKDPYYADTLSIQKTWYMQKIWGRISFNPSVSDDLFKNHLAYKYPETSSNQLFQAWSSASRSVLLANEQVSGLWDLDRDFWPEGWTGDAWTDNGRFLNLDHLSSVYPMKGSNLASFAKTVDNDLNGKISAWDTADEIESLANTALAILSATNSGSNTELSLNVKDLKAMSYLGLYNAYKFRALMHDEENDSSNARDAMGTAYCNWKKYTNIMDELYTGVEMQRNHNFVTWHDHDDDALQDYLDLGGSGEPQCAINYPVVLITAPTDNAIVEIQEGNSSVDVPIEVFADAGDNSIDRVELRSNGNLVSSDSSAPYEFVRSLETGEYTFEVRVIDNQGGTETDIISLSVVDPGSFNETPWIENFARSNGTISDDGPTSWSSNRNATFEIQNNELIINGSGDEGVLTTSAIDISGGPVDISLDVEPEAVDNQDYVRLYKVVNGGPEELIGEVIGNQNATFSGTADGANLVLIIRAKVSYHDEYYYMDNLSVTYSEGSGDNLDISISSPEQGASYIVPADVTISTTATAGASPIDRVEFSANGVLINTDSNSPYSFNLTGLTEGSYTIEATVYDDQGATDSDSVNITMTDSGTLNETPWIENFARSNGTTSDNGSTSWTSSRNSGIFEINGNELIVNGAGNEGVLTTSTIDISGGPVDISLDVDSAGSLENQDYVRLYKIVDGGSEELIGEVTASQSATFSGTANGSNLVLIIRARVSAEAEYYYLDNLNVTYSENDSNDETPWTENFARSNGTTSDNGSTSWTSSRDGGIFEINENELMINGAGNEGVLITNSIDISQGSVDISLDVNSAGSLENQDYVRLYKIVDGGSEELIGEATANQNTTLTGTVNGTNLVLVVRAKVSYVTEYYYMDNLNVTYSEGNSGNSDFEIGQVIDAVEYTSESHSGNDLKVRNMGDKIGFLDNGTWVRYENFNLGSGVSHFTIEGATGPNGNGGTVYLYLDQSDGILIGSIDITQTTGWNVFESFTTSTIDNSETGIRDLYLVFTGGFNIRSFVFAPEGVDIGMLIEAESYDEESHPLENGIVRRMNTKIGYIKTGSWVRYDAFDFGTETTSIIVNAGAKNTGGTLSLRLDTFDGIEIGNLQITSTGDFNTVQPFGTNLLEPAVGEHDLYLLFEEDSNTNGNYLFDIHSFQFD